MAYALPALPYAYDALQPYVSAQTLRLHHDILQRRYVEKLNAAAGDSTASLESIIVDASPGPVLDNALQVYNHTFLWHSMRPPGGPGPSPGSSLAAALAPWRGSITDAFVELALSVFGSGYVWLLADPHGALQVWKSPNAGNPLRNMPGHTPLLNVDVWEHAYLLDYGAERGEYTRNFLEHLANWGRAEALYADAFGG